MSATAAARHAQRLKDIAAFVRSVDPTITPAAVAGIAGTVAPSPTASGRLARYLAEHPDALVSGSSRALPMVAALIAALTAAGSAVVVAPRCAGCGRAVKLPKRRGEDKVCERCAKRANVGECAGCSRTVPVSGATTAAGARCARCRKRARLEACGLCGQVKQVGGRAGDGTARCTTCLRRDPSTWRECRGCGRTRPVNSRTPNGDPLCPSCYTSPPVTCSSCGRSGPVATHMDGQPICVRCYQHPTRTCGGCGRTRKVAVKARDGRPDLCPTCHQAPVLVCGRCGVTGPCRTTTADKSPICFGCQVDRRLDELLTGPAGTVLPALRPLQEAVSAANPRTALGWLGRSPAIPVLTAMAHGDQPLTHATLDAAGGTLRGQAFAVEHLRQLLISSGALPGRDRHLARTELAVNDLIAKAHPDDQQLLRTFTTWRLLGRLRRRSATQPTTPGAADRVRTHTAEAARFLAWLRDRSVQPADATQADLDAWLVMRPPARRHLVRFIPWARQQRLLGDVTIPTGAYQDPVWFTGDDHRWDAARRALTDDTLAVRDRVAAALLLLYGQPASRIVRLTRDHIRQRGDEVQLRLGKDHIVLPEPLDQLVLQLPEHRPVGMAGHTSTADPWLFPGRRTGDAMSAAQLGRRLRRLGIEPRADRNTALLQLATELPSVVIADLLGLHIAVAERWSQAAGARWTRYAGSAGRA